MKPIPYNSDHCIDWNLVNKSESWVLQCLLDIVWRPLDEEKCSKDLWNYYDNILLNVYS